MTTIDNARRIALLSDVEFNQQFMNFLDYLNVMQKPARWTCPECGYEAEREYLLPDRDRFYCHFCERPCRAIREEPV